MKEYYLDTPIRLTEVDGLQLLAFTDLYALVSLNERRFKYSYGRLFRKNIGTIFYLINILNEVPKSLRKSVIKFVLADAKIILSKLETDVPMAYILFIDSLTIENYGDSVDYRDRLEIYNLLKDFREYKRRVSKRIDAENKVKHLNTTDTKPSEPSFYEPIIRMRDGQPYIFWHDNNWNND